MKKLLLFLSFTVLLSSCGLQQEDNNKKVDEQKNIEQKKVLETHFKKDTLDKLSKFDKNNTRTEVNSLTGFLCFDEKLNHPASNISISTKNCKNENSNELVYFKIKGNSIYKVINKDESEIIKIETKLGTDTMGTYIADNIIANFSNILDQKDCKFRKIIKKDFLKNDTSKEIYAIEPIGFYKVEYEKQIAKNSDTIICQGYYPDLKIFFIYNPDFPKYFLHVFGLDPLMDFESLEYRPTPVNYN